MGGFAIGTTEFVTMGLLPQISAGVDVSIPTGGHVISAYALGVVVGAPLLAFLGARLPVAPAAGPDGGLRRRQRRDRARDLVRRAAGRPASLAGLPHGAYFGVASLVAASLASPARRAARWPW